MHPLFRSKFRLLTLVSLLLLSQCCCILLPLSRQARQETPTVHQMIQSIESKFSAGYTRFESAILVNK